MPRWYHCIHTSLPNLVLHSASHTLEMFLELSTTPPGQSVSVQDVGSFARSAARRCSKCAPVSCRCRRTNLPQTHGDGGQWSAPGHSQRLLIAVDEQKGIREGPRAHYARRLVGLQGTEDGHRADGRNRADGRARADGRVRAEPTVRPEASGADRPHHAGVHRGCPEPVSNPPTATWSYRWG